VPKFQLVLLIHAHQPVGNFDDVFERSYTSSYLPFIEVLERHPAIRVGLHYSGPLLEWIERAHPEYFERLAALVKSGQVEMVGGGFYEPVLIAIPPQDRLEQITRLADYIEKHFSARPRGAWLTERVWEPQIPSSLAPAGVEYTLLDDNHFLGAGFEPCQLYGYYTAEDLCQTVKVLPGLKTLRYMIPFRDVGETIEFLRAASRSTPADLPRWATTSKNSEYGRGRTTFAIAMAGWTVFSRPRSAAMTGWKSQRREPRWLLASRLAARICLPRPIPK
jgi:hypothetical protein